MSLTTWIVIIVVGAIVVAAVQQFAESSTKKGITLSVSERFPHAKLHAAGDGTYLAINAETEQIVVGRSSASLDGSMPYEAVYGFDQIATVELSVDGNSISRTNRGSQAVGAAVGALALGGVGAIVGGLTGSSTSTGTVRRISIKIIVDDPKTPFHDVTFFKAIDQKKGDKPNGIVIRQGRRIADEFHALLVGVIRTADRNKKDIPQALPNLSGQLKELWDLKELGAITPEEFETQKRAMMSRATG